MTITSHDQRAVQTRRITAADTAGFGRLVAVELRKMVDTRATRWLAGPRPRGGRGHVVHGLCAR